MKKTVYFCTECGNESPKWAGKCPSCGAWNCMVEQRFEKSSSGTKNAVAARNVKALPITALDTLEEIRFSTGMGELDRVLGGGAVKGSLVLVGGAPGIGKSTLMLQICQALGEKCKVLYVSGEESTHQIKMRAQRLQVDTKNLFVLSETRLSDVLECVDTEQPDVLIVDSIQTLYNDEADGIPGGVGQVKHCTMTLMQLAKSRDVTVFVIGHVNKEGAIAGPKVLEHMVDCVL
ncbi:MAG: DNA repair protein RadA, partial [Oscillospiraceae bacterium]|nr:DNA repair protein RadA [Oscillospiraceae bacterium]